MIKFFRKIRQKLLSENKFSKYLIYAIGEIVLVVIGILIALQINNWNIQNIEQQWEENTLSELEVELSSSQEDIEYTIKEFRWMSEARNYCLEAVENKYPLNEEFEYKVGGLAFYPWFQPKTSVFNSIQAKGLHVISSDSIRILIGEVYEQDYTFLEKAEKYSYERHHYIRQYLGKNLDGHDFRNKSPVVDYDKLINDPEFKSILNTLSVNEEMTGYFEMTLNKIVRLRGLIKLELEK